ncbi:hypothetical protein FIBSPDRAFT_1044368 [Athelia psychrophila]|uniref:Fungal STAND N-terminal Goodbye domain-containing protein n=1 Tax=Athelia psychrophila TaxID=1759441 RepID=A0A166JTU6_9AGAM|nr:hypothetical protein FIBSPDRAFT_1044368 [Fibularhizoctonia sp. CBS 109695]
MSAAADAVTGLAQLDLVGSFEMLLDMMGVLVKIGDEIAKIHPWVNLAWNVLSVGLKLVKAQQDRDSKIASLIQTMQSTYSIVGGSETLQDQWLQDKYARDLRTFTGKAIMETVSNTDNIISTCEDTFEQLREEFGGRITTQTALITVDLATKVNEIRFDQLLEKLKPATMDLSERKTCLPNTRLEPIKSILDWYSDDSDSRESMLDRVDGVNLLGAFFFFNRDLPAWNASTLIRTIAYQLAEFDPSMGAKIEQVIKTSRISPTSPWLFNLKSSSVPEL